MMASDHIGKSGVVSSGGGRQEGEGAVASSAVATPFAEVKQDAKLGAVRPIFRTPGVGGAQDGGPAIASSARQAPFAESEQQAEQAAVRPLSGAASLEPELSGTGFSYRHNWGPRRGELKLSLNWSAVNPKSRVLVSVGEGVAGGPDNGKFIGSARYTVYNVAPRAGGVDIWVNIEWGSDILLYVDYLVVNP
jgi:hypothetical protein